MSDASTEWDLVQARCADVPGKAGVELRRREYAPFFLRLAADVVIEERCRFYHPDRVILDDDARLDIGCLIYGSGGVRIGRHARLGPRTFIHSANHDVSQADPRAFFERGYDYKPVFIGDNVLISANVAILPGASIGNGCFVAANAVVTGKAFEAGSHLIGHPARPRAQPPSRAASAAWRERPEIALVTPQEAGLSPRLPWQRVQSAHPDGKPSTQHLDEVSHLLDVLGLPQVVVAQETERLPDSMHTVILLPNARPPADLPASAEIWQLAEGDVTLTPAAGRLVVRLPQARGRSDRGQEDTVETNEVSLPTERRAAFRPSVTPHSPLPERARGLALWLMDRLTKRGDPLPLAECLDWAVSLRLLRIDPGRPDRLLERILAAIDRRWPDGLAPSLRPTSAVSSAARDAWVDSLFEAACERWHALAHERPMSAHGAPARRPSLPAFFVWDALRARGDAEAAALRAKLGRAVSSFSSSSRLVGAGLAARLLADTELEERVGRALEEPAWWPERGGIPRLTPAKENLLLSPLLLAWWLTSPAGSSAESMVPTGFFDEVEEKRPITWSGFATPEGAFAVGSASRALIDEDTRRISMSLLDVWCELHSAPGRENHQRKLLENTYDGAVDALERVWLALFAHLQHRRGRPLIRLLPWPAPYRAALSLRYDVDRPVGAARVCELIDLQARHGNTAFGSWYFRHGDQTKQRLWPLLKCRWQECGVHVEIAAEAVAGLGATHHSAPTSHYWRGDESNRELERAGASHGEFHASELPTPRRALGPMPSREGPGASHQTDDAPRPAPFMVCALHFPLEGGTNDHDLAYFDRLIDAFRRRLGGGGHAIVASHPDLDQTPLVDLLTREDLNGVWFAPVGAVIERALQIMPSGRIRIGWIDNAGLALLADDDIADLQIQVFYPDGSSDVLRAHLRPSIPSALNELTAQRRA